jgi:hypothetical protein
MTSTERGGGRRRWPYLIPLLVIIVALMLTVWLPFVNQPVLWLGLPSMGVWTVLWVLAITAALAALEFGTNPDADEHDAEGGQE